MRATILTACVALCAPLSAQTKGEVVAAAFAAVRHGETFNTEYVTLPSTDRLPSLEGLTAAQYRRWLLNVRSDARIARMVLENHYNG